MAVVASLGENVMVGSAGVFAHYNEDWVRKYTGYLSF